MVQKSQKLAELEEDIRLTKDNLRLLTKTKKSCTCFQQAPHYHELINYDAESGSEYFETSEAKHQRCLEKLRRDLVKLESQLSKLRTKKQ